MGVRGLTSYIARHAELYLTPYELHDCNLVIDGDNLACNLYKDVAGTYSAFGGNYDDYFRSVKEFFKILKECNVCAYVLMDGGYEHRKLRTVGKRLRGKIAVIKRINPCGSIPVFPLLMKEVFVDAVRECGVPLMRCVFEADDELAALSRILSCPVLSYDSDFYIYNVSYIPLVTLTAKVHIKRPKTKKADNNAQTLRLHKSQARNLTKHTNGSCILKKIDVGDVGRSLENTKGTYKFLDCCIYRIDNLLARGSLSKEKLPLFAALLGNDYIARSSFKNFFTVSMGKAGRSRKMNQQQRRIRAILKWLKFETAESALTKILSRLKKNQRQSLLTQMKSATCGYLNENCQSYQFFMKSFENVLKFSQDEVKKNQENAALGQSDETSENSGDEASWDEDIDEDSDDVSWDEEYEDLNAWNIVGTEAQSDEQYEDDQTIDENFAESIENNRNQKGESNDVTKKFPEWFLDKLYPCYLARFFVDLMYLKKYINNPQIEHFAHNDSHEIAIPILIYIFTLLNSVEDDQTKSRKLISDYTTKPTEFTYLTRATRVTNIHYNRYEIGEPIEYPFNPRNPNPMLFRKVFDKLPSLQSEDIFEKASSLPQDLQMYFLSIIFWLQKSQHCDLLHLHSLIICLVVLRTVDSKIPPERDLSVFQKRYGKIIKKERLIRLTGARRAASFNESLKDLCIADRMLYVPKSDCYLVQDNLLKHFHMQEIFKKKYDSFSTTVLHGFSEFQSVVFQLHSLNALLDFPFKSCQMGKLYCGVFLYNLYDLLRGRLDVHYYVKNFIFQDSIMMFDFYCFLIDWCKPFVKNGKLKQQTFGKTSHTANKMLQKKQKQDERKKTAQVFSTETDFGCSSAPENGEEEFFDVNNKFCTLSGMKRI